MKTITILEAEHKELKACHLMLSQISLHVEDFCNPEDTTLAGVLRILAKYHAMKSNELYETLDKLNEDADI